MSTFDIGRVRNKDMSTFNVGHVLNKDISTFDVDRVRNKVLALNRATYLCCTCITCGSTRAVYDSVADCSLQ